MFKNDLISEQSVSQHLNNLRIWGFLHNILRRFSIHASPLYLFTSAKTERKFTDKEASHNIIEHVEYVELTVYYSAIYILVHFRYTSVGAKVRLGKASAPLEFLPAPPQIHLQPK